MRIILVEPKAPGPSVYDYARLPRLGLPLLAAILVRLGHDVRVYAEVLSPVDWDDIRTADLVGFSTITSTAPAAYEMAARVREMGIPTVIGGSHVTFLPDEALQYCDYVVRGEGQKTLPELVSALETSAGLSGIAGLSYKDTAGQTFHNPDRLPCTQEEFAALPAPTLDLIVGHENMVYKPIMTSWGCPHDCDFCSVVPMFGRKMRYRLVETVLDELERLSSSPVFIYDDNFVVDKKRTIAILRGIIERGIKLSWSAQMRAQAVFTRPGNAEIDHKLLTLMRLSGCKAVYCGFESVNQATLDAYNKRQGVWENAEAIRVFHEYGIHVHGMFVLGADTDDAMAPQRTVDFALQHQVDTVQFMVLTPFAGTRLRERLAQENRLLPVSWDFYDGHFCAFQPKQMGPVELQALTRLAMEQFYSIGRSLLMLVRKLPKLAWNEQNLWLRLLLSFSSHRIQDIMDKSWLEFRQTLRLPILRLYALKQMYEQEQRSQMHLNQLAATQAD